MAAIGLCGPTGRVACLPVDLCFYTTVRGGPSSVVRGFAGSIPAPAGESATAPVRWCLEGRRPAPGVCRQPLRSDGAWIACGGVGNRSGPTVCESPQRGSRQPLRSDGDLVGDVDSFFLLTMASSVHPPGGSLTDARLSKLDALTMQFIKRPDGRYRPVWSNRASCLSPGLFLYHSSGWAVKVL